MADEFSKARLYQFVEAYLVRSNEIDDETAFDRDHLAHEAIPGNEHALARLSKLYTPGSDIPLVESDLRAVMEAARKLLTRQCRSLSLPQPDEEPLAVEHELSRRIRLEHQGKWRVDDFRMEAQLETAKTPEDLGLPDILAWRDGGFDDTKNIRRLQRRSIKVQKEIVSLLCHSTDEQKKLDLLHIAISISALNHPGSRFHEQAFDSALTAAALAELHRLMYGHRVSDDVRRRATRLDIYLNFCRFNPCLDSFANFSNLALRNARLTPETWNAIRPFVQRAQMSADRLVELDPSDSYAIRERSSILSIHARLLAVSGNRSDLTEAERLHRESLRDLERISIPYGFAYPVLKNVVKTDLSKAIRACEKALCANEDTQNHSSMAAFAALLYQLTAHNGSNSTSDRKIRQLVRRAVLTPSIRYQFSHVFGAKTVWKLLCRLGDRRSEDPRGKQ